MSIKNDATVSNLESRSSVKMETNTNITEPTIVVTVEEKVEVKSNRIKPNYLQILSENWLDRGCFGKFLNKSDLAKFTNTNKQFRKLIVTSLIAEYERTNTILEEKLKEQNEKCPNPETEFAPFALSRGALKAIDLLNDPVHLTFFNNAVYPANDDIILIYRIFFQLLHDGKYLQIKDNKEFWAESCKYFAGATDGKIGPFIAEVLKAFDFSDDNIYAITQMVGSNTSKISPAYYSKLCGTSGFLIFLIKDSLEYAGIIVDKKPNQSRILKNLKFQQDKEKEKLEKLKGSMEKLN